MNRCVNIKSKEFRTLADSVDISPESLELYVHKYQNERNTDSFPSVEEVKEMSSPKPFNGNKDIVQLKEQKYSTPQIFSSIDAAIEAQKEAIKYFGEQSINLETLKDGTYRLIVGEPDISSDVKFSKFPKEFTDYLQYLSNQNLIHKYKGEWYISKSNGEADTSLERINAIKERINRSMIRAGIPVESISFEITKNGFAVRVKEEILNDKIAKDTSVATNQEDLTTVFETLKSVFPNLRDNIIYITAEEAKKMVGNVGNAFIKNNQIYIIKGTKVNQSTIIEECLHPFINSLYHENTTLYNNLLQEAKRDFKQLQKEIGLSYRESEGFTNADREQELVTQALTRYYKGELKNAPKTFKEYARQFLNWFQNMISKATYNFKSGKYNIRPESINERMTLQELSNLLRTSDLEINVGYDSNTRFNREEINDFNEFTVPYKIGTTKELGDGLAKTNGQTGEITISKDVTVEQFFDYIQGNIESITSQQKKEVFRRLNDIGYGLDKLKELITTSEDVQKLLYYHELSHLFNEDKSHYFSDAEKQSNYTVIDYMAENKVEIETRATLDAINRLQREKKMEQNQQEIKDKEKEKFLSRQQDKMVQLRNLTLSDVISASEAREIAEQAVYWISDHITRLQEDKEYAVQMYGEQYADVDFSQMSRMEVVNTIGVNKIVEACRNRFDPEYNDYLAEAEFETLDKADLIVANWDAIMLLAKDAFEQVENFSIVSADSAKKTENQQIDVDNFNNSNDESTVLETEGNLQEHWQIESRSIDIISTMSQKVKRALIQCYKVDKNGERVTSEFGIYERVPLSESTNTILRLTQGTLTLNTMKERLLAASTNTMWLNQMLERLTDTTGKEAEFQSQFFTVFSKYAQKYDVVTRDENGFAVKEISTKMALNNVFDAIKSMYLTGQHPLFTTTEINNTSLDVLRTLHSNLSQYASVDKSIDNAENKEAVVNLMIKMYQVLGFNPTQEMLTESLDKAMYKTVMNKLYHIIQTLNRNVGNKEYKPFEYGTNNGNLISDIKGILEPLTNKLEDLLPSSFYENGKMYQTYVTPSYLTKLFQKFNADTESFLDFVTEEYSDSEWFHTGNSIERGWRNVWLDLMMASPEMRKNFSHKVQLNFNGSPYMKQMSPAEYALSVISEYFVNSNTSKNSMVPAWFRVPIMSNKPSSEFIRFYKYVGANYQRSIVNGLVKVMGQEISRIQTVLMRNRTKKDADFIKNFDTNGKKFCFLQELNPYLNGDKANTEFGKLLNAAVNGKEFNAMRLNELATEILMQSMTERAEAILKSWEETGILDSAKNIQNIGNNKETIRENLTNFIWNDRFASINILQLSITDIAYYKDAEDLQKRLGQLHSPGTRGNWEVTDFEGNRVSDGKSRTVLLKDFEGVISNVIENVSIIMDKKIQDAKTKEEKDYYESLKESLVGKDGAYRNINVTDGQGYSSITSYRKKALAFGKWSREAEEVYQKIRSGNYTYNDLKVALQPLKPFVYTQSMRSTNVDDAPISTLKMPIQYKNSEYLLLMADALMQGENTGKPNLLRAIMEVMEESHYDKDGNYKLDGIDTVTFESATKSGITQAIDLTKYLNAENGEILAKRDLESHVYERELQTTTQANEKGELEEVDTLVPTGNYDSNFVIEYAAEDYSIQQEIPSHFQEHDQAIGSQARYIIPSELAITDAEGNMVEYNVNGTKYTAEEFKRKYEELNSKNIEESIEDVIEVFKLKGTKLERNQALSEILQKEILSDSRYGIDLLQACSLDEQGNFRIPIGDPIQSKRIEQLIHSIIKNRVNKQEIAGGPIVQVTSFGTTKSLNVRYKDKNGNLLLTKEEWEHNNNKRSIKFLKNDNAEDIVIYRGYALMEDREAKNLDETIGHTAVDYDDSVKGSVYFTSSEEGAREYANFKTDKSEETFVKDGKIVTQRNRHYTGDYAKVSSYKIKNTAVVEYFEDIIDYKKNGKNTKADVIILKRGTLGQDNAEYIVLNKDVIVPVSSSKQSYEDYCKENQGDLAYYEAYAPIWSQKLLDYFADSKGHISTEVIDMLSDKLLKMISYRIPTEDKYSVFPIKIVGFLPREAGDAIMLPNDITLLTGSD